MQYNRYLLEGKPYFISALEQQLSELRAQGKDMISLIMGDPLEPTYPPVREATLKALEQTIVSQYPKNKGEPAYRQAVADWAQDYYGVTLDPELHILSCNGTKEAIFHLPLLFDWSNGKEMFISSLSYPVYASAARTLNVPLRELSIREEGGFLPELDAIPAEVWQKCQVFWINSPHNPTTAIASRAYFERLLELAETYDFLVCSDECYNELYYTEERPPSCLEIDSQRCLVLRSLSKRSHMTGYRMGALISRNVELMRLLAKLREPIGVGTPTFIQQGGITAWQDHKHPEEAAKHYRYKRDVIRTELEAIGCKVFGGNAGFYLWFSHPNCADSESLCKAFIEAGLMITPGTAFGEDGRGYARLTYCVTADICEEVARRIKQVPLSAGA